MSTRVIQKIIQFIHLVLHRGFGSFTSNPYIFKINNIVPRCSGTFIKKNRNIRVLGITASLALSILTIATIFPITKQSDTAEATYVPATTTLSIVSSKDTASVDITPTSSTGTFATSAAADMAEFTVTTDNLTGYSLNILGTDTSGQLVNSTTGDTLDTITADTTENDFRTGNASTYNNKWGYRLTVNSTTTTNFFSAPTSTTVAKTIYSTTGPNTTGTSDSFTLGLGARIDYTKPTGTYTNTFIITAIANNISYQINYLDSDGTTTLLPPDAESNISASSIELNSTTPTKSDYEFKGWCDGTLSSDGTSCTGTPGTTYQPGDTYTFTNISSASTNTANLYAVWKESTPIMQNLSLSQCTTTPMTVVDKRDNKEYTIARLADGQCWMTSNLNLAGGTALYSDDSDVDPANTRASGTPYYTLPSSSSSGFSSDTVAYVYNTGNETTSQANCTSTQACNSYYSWLAATAGGKDTSGAAVTGNGPDAAYSICPKGWRLPKSGNQSDTSATSTTGYKKGDFYKLATAYGANLESSYYQNTTAFNTNAGPGTLPNFLLAGDYNSSSFYDGGTYGRYWSSSSYSSTYAYGLIFGSSYVDSAESDNRRLGFSVRCVLQPTMQNFTTQEAESMTTGESRTLVDSRDGKSYTVAKLADGQIWMTSNLNLAGGTALYSDDSDVDPANTRASGTPYYTLPNSSSSGFSSDTVAYVYNTGNETTTQTSAANNSYYSWLAATAGGKDADGNAVTGNGPDAAYSICPKGWRLPKSGNNSDTSATSTTGYKKGDFYKLATAYGANLESSYYQSSAVFYNNAGPGTLPNFLLAGYYYSSTFGDGGTGGNYWSSSSSSSTKAYQLHFTSSLMYSARNLSRRFGFPVRCVFAGA